MTRSLAPALLLALLAVGCGGSGDDKPGLGPPPVYPVPGCEHIEHRPCDIRLAPCQERLMELAACLRGSDPLPVPPVTNMTTAEFADLLNRNIAENPPPDRAPFERALMLFALVEQGALDPRAIVAADVEFIWGFYRNDEKDIIIVDHGVPADEPDPNSVIVHEFVHALQDADVSLSDFRNEHAKSYDSNLATLSVIEGEAQLHQSRFWSSLLGLDPGAIDWDSRFQELTEFAEEQVLENGSPYNASYSYFPYDFGARLVHHAWRERGLAGTDELFAAPPERSQAVMASATDVAVSDWPAPEFGEIVPPEPWEAWGEDSLGAWGAFLYFALRGGSPDSARALALDLLGDRFGIYVTNDASADVAAVWQLEFASEESARLASFRAPNGASSFVHSGNRVVFALATRSLPVDWALVP